MDYFKLILQRLIKLNRDITENEYLAILRVLNNWESMPMSEKAKGRSKDYDKMLPTEQWTEDKRLGILDWDGSENM